MYIKKNLGVRVSQEQRESDPLAHAFIIECITAADDIA